jgi:hypothetical protein
MYLITSENRTGFTAPGANTQSGKARAFDRIHSLHFLMDHRYDGIQSSSEGNLPAKAKGEVNAVEMTIKSLFVSASETCLVTQLILGECYLTWLARGGKLGRRGL